jgi:hypothetical protein
MAVRYALFPPHLTPAYRFAAQHDDRFRLCRFTQDGRQPTKNQLRIRNDQLPDLEERRFHRSCLVCAKNAVLGLPGRVLGRQGLLRENVGREANVTPRRGIEKGIKIHDCGAADQDDGAAWLHGGKLLGTKETLIL